MDHAVRDHREPDRGAADHATQSEHEKAAEKKLQREKLREIRDLPGEDRAGSRLMRAAIEGIDGLEIGSARSVQDQRKDGCEHPEVEPPVLPLDRESEAVIAQAFPKDRPNEDRRDDQEQTYGPERPPQMRIEAEVVRGSKREVLG